MKEGQANLTQHPPASGAMFRRADFFWVALIAVLGLAAVIFHQRTPDFMGNDAFYADAARCILQHGYYGVNGVPETTQPPGLAGILAALYSVFGYSYTVSVQAMAVFEMLGFLVVYKLLERRESRLVAAIICIILITSPVYFAWASRQVFAAFPYFFTTMLALLSGEEYEKAANARTRVVWGVILAVSVAASLLIATSTITLLGAIVIALTLTALRNPRHAHKHLLKMLPILVIGITVQLIWTHRQPAPLGWSLPGYPDSYWNQLGVKDGNYPELGMATLGDIPSRVAKNLLAESDIFFNFVLRHGVNEAKTAVVIVPVLLVTIGWTWSVWRSGGTGLVEWYFAGYQVIYLLWPFVMQSRFVFPIAPLACFYAWRGIHGAILAIRSAPRIAGIVSFPLALLLGLSGLQFVYRHRMSGFGKWPDELLIPCWLIYAAFALWMALTGRSILSSVPFVTLNRWLRQPRRIWRLGSISAASAVASLVVVGSVIVGVGLDVRVASENLATTCVETNAERTEVSEFESEEVEAGVWLRTHTSRNVIIMARNWPTVYHFTDRKSVWFPPISNPDVLLDGIEKHDVDYVVVIHHSYPYYLPDDDACFDKLLSSHPANFKLILNRSNTRIFKVMKDATVPVMRTVNDLARSTFPSHD